MKLGVTYSINCSLSLSHQTNNPITDFMEDIQNVQIRIYKGRSLHDVRILNRG